MICGKCNDDDRILSNVLQVYRAITMLGAGFMVGSALGFYFSPERAKAGFATGFAMWCYGVGALLWNHWYGLW